MKILKVTAAVICAALMLCSCAKNDDLPNEGSESEDEQMAVQKGRFTNNFNNDWKFLKLTQKGGLSELAVEKPDLDDSDWESITLPHTWNAVDGCDGWSGIDEGGEHYYRGPGGYRKSYFFASDRFADKDIFLEFEGANTVTELYVNGTSAGVHEGGYAAFRFDITEYVKLDEENIIAVKVNNAPTDYIAPITNQGDFTKMGGIYRDVTLISVPKTHIDLMDYGSSGIYITPKNITADTADVDILVKLANNGQTEENITVKAEIYGMDGSLAAQAESGVSIAANINTEAKMSLNISKPVLWNGVENPYLYDAKITVLNENEILDQCTQTFGIRTYNIDPDDGFFLNGSYLDLRGVNYHQDSCENGWAMTDEQRERDYNMMLDMGCNTVRMAHYQHDSYEYDLCDRLGITVWTEIGIVNKMSADETDELKIAERFTENAKRQLTELIRQNYNHPSVIVWGISNELYQMSDEIYDIYTELNELANTEDETRLITFADSQFWGKFLELPADVVGYNRYFGWYKEAGSTDKFGEWLDSYHGAKETRPVCVSEYGGGAAVSQHKDNIDWLSDIDPWGTRHYENYQSEMHEKIWAQFSQRQYLWGKYIWCMFDFASDGREEGDTKGQNDKGLVTREREPKDSFYFYKSVWNDEPMLHITEKRFTISKIKVVTHKPGARAYKFIVSVSDTRDGEYTVISDHSNNTDTSGYFTDLFLKPFSGRYVKIEVTGCSDTNAYPCIWELEVYKNGSDDSQQESSAEEGTAQTAAVPADREDTAAQFMDCFEPMPIINKLSDDCWGVEKVGPRDQDNGLEDKTMIVRSENDAEHDYTYWDGGIIKDDRDPTGQTYYMFASRWDATTGSHYDWAKSQAIVAISTTGLYGPYEDQGLIWPDNAGGKGHNIFPLKLKEDDPSGYKYAIVACETRPTEIFCSQSLDGPWTSVCQLQHQADENLKSQGIEPKYVDSEGKSRSRFNGKNICIFIRPDGRYQAFGRDGDIALADSIAGPWTVVSEYTKGSEDKTLWDTIPSMNPEKMEDPVMWYSDGLYHLIVNSWEVKEASYLTSKDGISGWTLHPGKAYTPKTPFLTYTDGTVNRWTKLERPNVYIENGKIAAITFAAIDSEKWEDKANDEHGSKIIVVPFNHDKLIRFVTGGN